MGELTEIVSLLATIGGLIGLVGGPWIFVVGRKYFAEAKNVVTPFELEKRLEIYKAAIINDVNGIVGRSDMLAIQRHDQLVKSMDDVKDGMQASARLATSALGEAKEAGHRAELVQERVAGIREVLETRLNYFESLIKGGSK